MKTKIFCDSADYSTIKKFNKNSLVRGFTTNPSLMRKAGAKNYKNYSLKLLKVCKKKPRINSGLIIYYNLIGYHFFTRTLVNFLTVLKVFQSTSLFILSLSFM